MKKLLSTLLLLGLLFGCSTGAYAADNVKYPTAGVSAVLMDCLQNYMTIETTDYVVEVVADAYEENIQYATTVANIRTGPGKEYEIASTTVRNEEIKVIGEVDDWNECEYDGESYYIHSKYLSAEKLEELPYTDKELEVMAHILWAEAGSCSDKAIYYVGSVIMNRVARDDYPDNVIDVVYQKGQYSPTWHGFMNRKPSERCYEIAEDLLTNGSILPQKIVGSASASIANRYGIVYEVVDGIYFFSLKR